MDEVDLIVDSLFGSLQKKRIRLTMIMDNILDAGVRDDKMKDRMKALARAATKYGHMILFTTQDKEAAQSIGQLNGVTTNIAKKQNFTRWSLQMERRGDPPADQDVFAQQKARRIEGGRVWRRNTRLDRGLETP